MARGCLLLSLARRSRRTTEPRPGSIQTPGLFEVRRGNSVTRHFKFTALYPLPVGLGGVVSAASRLASPPRASRPVCISVVAARTESVDKRSLSSPGRVPTRRMAKLLVVHRHLIRFGPALLVVLGLILGGLGVGLDREWLVGLALVPLFLGILLPRLTGSIEVGPSGVKGQLISPDEVRALVRVEAEAAGLPEDEIETRCREGRRGCAPGSRASVVARTR